MVHAQVPTSKITQRKELLMCEGEFLKVQKKKKNTRTLMSVCGDAQDLSQDENSPLTFNFG